MAHTPQDAKPQSLPAAQVQVGMNIILSGEPVQVISTQIEQIALTGRNVHGDEIRAVLVGDEMVPITDTIAVAPEIKPCKTFLVVTGPSAAGKTTMIRRFLRDYPSKFAFCVSHTTRERRSQEKNGADYHFVSEEMFQKMVQSGRFVEWTKIGDVYYGTSFDAVRKVLRDGRICVMDVDVRGCKNLMRDLLDEALDIEPVFIYLTPPNVHELERRLALTGSETPVSILHKLERVKEELAEIDTNLFNMVVNDDQDRCYDELVRMLKEELGDTPPLCKCASAFLASEDKIITGTVGFSQRASGGRIMCRIDLGGMRELHGSFIVALKTALPVHIAAQERRAGSFVSDQELAKRNSYFRRFIHRHGKTHSNADDGLAIIAEFEHKTNMSDVLAEEVLVDGIAKVDHLVGKRVVLMREYVHTQGQSVVPGALAEGILEWI